ncbi:MAG TPA: TolC family protein [Noviherbaspirillum sp.]|uniref:TolC family protein n=1 Tax=Noviherbaspirillum sp. TaxID=1926288 RepID=UPI002F95D5A6
MKPTRIAALIATTFAVSACAVRPVAISDDDHHLRAQQDQRRLYDEQEAVAAPMSLADAVARALKYNMDYRTRLMEEASAMGQTELASFDMLPRLTAAAGYSWRNNEAFGFGFTPAGTISTTPSAAVERTHHTNNLTFAWNVLDFGLSYVRARQLADQSLIAEERRRKAQQNLLLDVRSAWWRAEAAQRLLPEIDTLLAEVDQAASRARLIETRKLLPPLQIVAYRRSLLDLTQQIALRRQELEQAKLDLAQLVNLRPGQELKLTPAETEDFVAPDLASQVDKLEALALDNRPELREEAYRARITDLEGKKQLLALLPSIGLDAGTNYDSNRYLLNNRWASAGLNVSFNLIKAFSLPAVRRSNEAAARVDETRRLAATAAVLAQTRLAAVRYTLLSEELGIWNDAVQDDTRIVGYLNASKDVGLETELELIRAKARRMISRVNRELVHASLQGAMGRIYTSVGLDALPLEIESHSAAALSTALAERLEKWEGSTFVARAAPVARPVAVPDVAGLPPEAAQAFTGAMQRILRLSKIAVSEANAPAPYRVETRVTLMPPNTSGQQARVKVRLLGEGGAVLSESEQSSMLVTPIGPDQWRALGEGAGYRMVTPLRAEYAARRTAPDATAAAASDASPASQAAATASAQRPAATTAVLSAAALLDNSEQVKLQLDGTIKAANTSKN